MIARTASLSLLLLVTTAGCTHYDGDYKLPGVYRIDIQQGNVLDQDMIDRLKPGMNRNQVRFIMGTPAIEDPFHAGRWDYIYTNSWGGGVRKQIHVTLYFQDDELAYLDGDVASSLRKPPEEFKRKSKIVDVPLREFKPRTLFSRIVDSLPVIGNDDTEPTAEKEPEPGESDGTVNIPIGKAD